MKTASGLLVYVVDIGYSIQSSLTAAFYDG